MMTGSGTRRQVAVNNALLLLDLLFLAFWSPFLLYIIVGSSYEMLDRYNVWLFPMYGGIVSGIILVVSLLPRKVRSIVLWFFLISVNLYLFFYLYVFWALWMM